MIFRYTISWLILVVIAILNGAIREMVYKKTLGDLLAHQVSTITFIILIAFFVWGLRRRWELQSTKQALTVGFIWLGFTVVFEFLFGHFVMGNPWSKLLHDYNILEGRLWILILLWITIAPYFFYRRKR
jgi:hypothetical protein